MSKGGVCSFFVCAICIFVISVPLSAAEQPIPQQVLDWQKAAQTSVKAKDIPKAISYYEQIEQSFPNTSYALNAKTQIICLEIRTSQDTKVQTDIAILETKYSSHENYLKAIQAIGSQYRKSHKHNMAIALYQKTLGQFPDREQSVFLKQDEVITFLEIKKRSEADSSLDNLMSRYKTSSGYSKAIWTIAKEYRDTAMDCSKTRLLCTQLLEQFGQDTEAYLYQCTIIRTYLKENNLADAGAGIDILLSRYNNSDIPKQAVDLGWIYLKECHNPDKSIELCRKLLTKYPNDTQSIRMQSLLTISLLEKKEFVRADKEADSLLTQYGQHPDFVIEICDVGGILRSFKQNDKAVQLFEEVLRRKPKVEYQLRAHTELGRIYASQGEDARTQEKINLIYSDYKNLKGAGKSVFAIGNEYYLQADDLIKHSKTDQARPLAIKSQKIWETLLQQLPMNDHAAEATLSIGYGYIILGDYQKTIQYCRQLVQTWPTSELAPQAYMLMANYLDRTISADTTNADLNQRQIEDTYKTIIERYPKSKFAVEAMYALGSRCIAKENYQDGIKYYKQILEKAPNDKLIPTVLLSLGEVYEKTGDKVQAKEVYTLLLQKISAGGIYEQVKQKLRNL
jgi:TolA-binding protein